MKKRALFLAMTVIFIAGCQQLEEQAQNIRKGGEEAINQASQQVENAKTKIIQTKQQFDEKSQQVINAVDAVDKLTK